jgi:hypothetical protein
MAINVEGDAHPVDGAWMVSSAQMDDNRTVVCNIALTATYKFASFHALVRLEYVSGTGHLLGLSQQWEHDCGPAPLIGAAHANGTFTETAPPGTSQIRLVQLATYKLDFSDLFPVIDLVMRALGALGDTGRVDFPTTPGDPYDTTVEPPDWYSYPELKDLVSVAEGTA